MPARVSRLALLRRCSAGRFRSKHRQPDPKRLLHECGIRSDQGVFGAEPSLRPQRCIVARIEGLDLAEQFLSQTRRQRRRKFGLTSDKSGALGAITSGGAGRASMIATVATSPPSSARAQGSLLGSAPPNPVHLNHLHWQYRPAKTGVKAAPIL